MVFARGLMVFPLTEFFLTLPPLLAPTADMLSLRPPPFRGRLDGVVVMCSFCWCLSSRSLLAKHRVHSGHSNGFSLVCERSWRFKCSSLANDREQMAQTWGLGLSVFGGGNSFAGLLLTGCVSPVTDVPGN